jgi:hypothetical protein
MRKASTRLLEQGTHTPSPAPDLIPAETKTNRDLHWDWYSKRGHFRRAGDFSTCNFKTGPSRSTVARPFPSTAKREVEPQEQN